MCQPSTGVSSTRLLRWEITSRRDWSMVPLVPGKSTITRTLAFSYRYETARAKEERRVRLDFPYNCQSNGRHDPFKPCLRKSLGNAKVEKKALGEQFKTLMTDSTLLPQTLGHLDRSHCQTHWMNANPTTKFPSLICRSANSIVNAFQNQKQRRYLPQPCIACCILRGTADVSAQPSPLFRYPSGNCSRISKFASCVCSYF
jgi:hypothetical protein